VSAFYQRRFNTDEQAVKNLSSFGTQKLRQRGEIFPLVGIPNDVDGENARARTRSRRFLESILAESVALRFGGHARILAMAMNARRKRTSIDRSAWYPGEVERLQFSCT
jgi:hypothetical protein